MKSFNDKLTKGFIDLKSRMFYLKNEQRGDTNFISIIIVLAIVLGAALIFMRFKDQILGTSTKQVEGFQEEFTKTATAD